MVSHHSHGGIHFQGHSLEKAMYYGDHLDDIHDTTQVRTLNKLKFLEGKFRQIYLPIPAQDKPHIGMPR